MKTLTLVLAFAALAAAQKQHRPRKPAPSYLAETRSPQASQNSPIHHGRPQAALGHQGGGGSSSVSHNPGGAGAGSFANFPDFASSSAGRFPGAAPQGHGGSQSFAAAGPLGSSGASGSAGGANFANFQQSLGGPYNGPYFTNTNPYTGQGSQGPVNAGFDLGNGGQFAIHFSPGATQEYNPNQFSGDYSLHGLQGHGGQHAVQNFGGSSSQAHGQQQGRY